MELEFEDGGFCGGRKTGEPGEKPSEQGDKQQPTCGTGPDLTLGTLLEGQRFHHHAIPALLTIHKANSMQTNDLHQELHSYQSLMSRFEVGVIIHLKDIELFFFVVLSIVSAVQSVPGLLSDHKNESFQAVLSRGAVYYKVQGAPNF